MSDDEESHLTEISPLARKIREIRSAAGLSQTQLAIRVGYSRQYVSRAERPGQGLPSFDLVKSIDVALGAGGALVAAHAEAQRARIRRRQGDDTSSRLRAAPRNDMEHTPVPKSCSGPAVDELCNVLTDFDGRSDKLGGKPSTVHDLRRDLDYAFTAYQQSHFMAAASRAATLLVDAQIADHEAQGELEMQNSAEVLALAHHVASSVLTKLRQPDLALLAAERGHRHATRSESFPTRLSLIRAVAFTLLANGRPQPAMRLIDSSLGSKSDVRLTSGADVSVVGTLALVGALAAARFGDGSRSKEYLTEAGCVAQALGCDANYYWTAFGPTNVLIHRVNTAAELGDMRSVADSGPLENEASVPVERRIRYSLDIARAQGAIGRRNEALETILLAERIAPEQVRQHHLSRGTVNELMRTVTGTPSVELDQLARRMELR